MQTYDLLMLAVMAGSIIFGLRKGFAWQVASIASIIVSYFVARNFSGIVADRIGGDPAWNKFLAMFILFFGSSLAIWMAFGFVRTSIERMHLKSFDSQIGGALGAAKGALLCTIVTLFSVSLLGDSIRKSVCTSLTGNYVAHALNRFKGVVPPEIDKYIGPYVNRFQNEMNAHQTGGSENVNPTGPAGFPALGNGTGASPGVNPFGGIPAPGGGSWLPPMEQIGQLYPANQFQQPQGNSWQGQLEQVDFGQAATELLNSIMNRGSSAPVR